MSHSELTDKVVGVQMEAYVGGMLGGGRIDGGDGGKLVRNQWLRRSNP